MIIDGWSNVPPTRENYGSGLWWHWNGDRESAPYALRVQYSGASGKMFVEIRDDPLTRAVDDPVHEGWWKEIPNPSIPSLTQKAETDADRLPDEFDSELYDEDFRDGCPNT